MLPIDYTPAADPHDGLADPVNELVWLEPYPDTNLGLEGPAGPEARYEQREAVELAFIAALQHLPARQRAVRSSATFSASQPERPPTHSKRPPSPAIAPCSERTGAWTNGSRAKLSNKRYASSGDDQLSRLVERYVDAWERNDIDAVVSMLTEDARMTMPPLPSWYSGRGQVAAFLRGYALADIKRWQLIPTSANGQPALAGYLWDEQTEAFMPYCLYVLTLREGQIEGITPFVSPKAFQRLGLPGSIAA